VEKSEPKNKTTNLSIKSLFRVRLKTKQQIHDIVSKINNLLMNVMHDIFLKIFLV
jgi:hypothetical protein